MSVQSIGQDTANSWLSQLLASFQNQSAASQSSAASLFGLSDATSGTSGDASSATSSGSTGSGSSVGSFNDILAALLSGGGSLGYDMQTGMLTDLSASGASGGMPPPPPMEESDGLTRDIKETENEDGSLTRSVTVSDADGNVVGTEKTTQNADGSFSSVITTVLPDGKTVTRTITGENTDDGGFSVTNALTDADGNILEKGQELTAADGSVTRSQTRYLPDGSTLTEAESFDADGNLISTTTTATGTAAVAAASDTSSTTGSSGSADASASDSAGSASSAAKNQDTTTTVTTLFTSEGLEQTTTVTDAAGKILSQNTKDIPFSATADSQSYGATEGSKEGLSGLVGQYAAGRYGAGRYAAQQAAAEASGQGSGISVEA